MQDQLYQDRIQAGKALADALWFLRDRDPLIIALPRGGVPVAAQIADKLQAPLGIMLVRKVGMPGHPEYAIGAVSESGLHLINRGSVQSVGMEQREMEAAVNLALSQLGDQIRRWRRDYPQLEMHGRTVVLVDDGMATGLSMGVAIHEARRAGASEVVVASPVASPDTVSSLGAEADQVVCPQQPHPFHAVGLWYGDFSQVHEREVEALLEEHGAVKSGEEVEIEAGDKIIYGNLQLPQDARGLVIFAHGSGSGRFSTRNRHVATSLAQFDLATLLIDLLTPEEEAIRSNVFDIPLLASRLQAACMWAEENPDTDDLPIGYFGASTGAGAALLAASRDSGIHAVVSRGGRPDLAGSKALREVEAPTLLLVGSLDHEVLKLNRAAQEELRCISELKVVPGASHLFEEPGTLDQVAEEAGRWFSHYLQPAAIGAA